MAAVHSSVHHIGDHVTVGVGRIDEASGAGGRGLHLMASELFEEGMPELAHGVAAFICGEDLEEANPALVIPALDAHLCAGQRNGRFEGTGAPELAALAIDHALHHHGFRIVFFLIAGYQLKER